MTSQKDMVKRERIAVLLKKGTEPKAIAERVGCSKDLVYEVRRELKGAKK